MDGGGAPRPYTAAVFTPGPYWARPFTPTGGAASLTGPHRHNTATS